MVPTYADAWNAAEESGVEYTSSQNPWSNTGDGDAGFSILKFLTLMTVQMQ